MIALALCSMALADAAFSGFRANAGRDGRIAKREAKARACLVGAAAGSGVLVILAAVLLGSIGAGLTTMDDLVGAGERMLIVYAGYATAIAAGFVAYFSPWLEVRSLATMLVLGPGTFVRPAVIVAGAIAAGVHGGWVISGLAMIAATLMLLVEPMLGGWFDRHQATALAPFVRPRPPRRGRRHGR